MTKGTKVRIQTTNGGDSVAVLLEDYRPHHSSVAVDFGHGCFVMWHDRIRSITEIS
jgi:hypothetical protein